MEAPTNLPTTIGNDEALSLADVLERRQRNELSPINLLPPELLLLIIHKIHRNHSYKALFALRSVCKYWMELIDSSPEFWTSVSLSDDDKLLSTVLQKSNNQILHVHFTGRGWETGQDDMMNEKITNFLRNFIHTVGTWRSIEYRATFAGCYDQILGLPLHNLEILVLECAGSYELQGYRKPLDAPKLRCIDLTEFALDWGSLPSLRDIRITAVSDIYSVEGLRTILERCPDLETFKIFQPPVWWDEEPSNVPFTPIRLPKLQSLVLIGILDAPCSDLLSSIDAPNVHQFEVSWESAGGGWDESGFVPTFQSIGRYLGAYRQQFDNEDCSLLRFVCSRDAITFAVGSMRSRLYVDGLWIGEQDYPMILNGLSAALAEFDPRVSEGIKVIQFSGHHCRENMMNLCPLLHRHLPNVGELVVTLTTSQGRPDADWVLELLSSPAPLEDGASWLFPKLTALSLRAGRRSICDGVLGIVEARQTGDVQAIQRVSIRKGRIGRDTAAKLKTSLDELLLADTKFTEVVQ